MLELTDLSTKTLSTKKKEKKKKIMNVFFQICIYNEKGMIFITTRLQIS